MNLMHTKQRTLRNPKKRIVNACVHILLTILAVIWLLPLIWVLLASLQGEAKDNAAYVGAYFPSVIPRFWTLKNYTEMFEQAQRQIVNFPRMFLNTFFIAVFSCIISSTFVIFTSYTMSRRRFKTREKMIRLTMILGLFPGFMAMIAIYHMMKAAGLLEGNLTYLALILIYSGGSGMGFLLLKGYMDSIPRDLDEAAYIDGATQWQIFKKIILPISKPMIVFQVITSFLGPWLDFINARVIAGANSKYWTVSVGLYAMLERERINNWYANFMAGSVLISIPIAILTIIMQKFYNQSLSGAVKG